MSWIVLRIESRKCNGLIINQPHDSPLGYVFGKYADDNKLNFDALLFRVRRTGMYCSPQDTPDSLSLVNDEIIDVLVDANDV